jgi:hypothetical protein
VTTDTRTANQNYPLPYPSNLLAADVVRLRDALTAIDSDITNSVSQAELTLAINVAINGLVDGSAGQLDTLNELSDALGDDENYAATVATALAARLELAGGTLTGDLTLSGDPTSALHAATKQFVEAAPATWSVANTAATLDANKRYLVDSSAASFTLTLPASPTAGQFVTLADSEGCFATYPVTIAQNGSNIVGQAADLVANVDRAVISLIYSGDSTTGWLVK